MTSGSAALAWSKDYIACVRNFKDLSQDRILTDYQDVQPTQFGMVFYPEKGSPKLDWDEIGRFCRESGFVRRYEDSTTKGLYRFDLQAGYYQPFTVDQLTNMLLTVISCSFNGITLPASFRNLVESNVVPRLPSISDRMGSSPEFEALSSYYNDKELIPFKNGVYSVQDNVLLPRTSFLFIDHPLNVCFDPSVLDDDIRERFMEMMCGNECLYELLFEQIGYALYARSFIVPTITIFYGSGANGKSVVLDLVARIVGDDNISTLSMYDMTNAFSLASSEGKLLNLSTDSSAGPGETLIATANTAEFMKKASSGEAFAFNPKYGQLHKGFGPRKFMFASNVMLKFGGIDEGLARRIYAIPFDATFKEDSAMKAKLLSERTKTWFAMQALISLGVMIHRAMGESMFIERDLSGCYIDCKAAEDMKIEQLTSQDTVLDWLTDELDLDIMDKDSVAEALMGVASLYESYCAFCAASKRTAKGRKMFHSTLRSRFGLEFKRSTKGVCTNHTWYVSHRV